VTITINGTTGLAGVDGSASTPAVQGTDTNSGVFYPAADTVAIATNGTERMRVRSDGNMGIGGVGLATTTLQLNKDITGGSVLYQVYSNGTIQSDATSAVSYYITSLNTAASSFTLASLRHFAATEGTIGAGSAITNQYGFFANTDLIDATNNYGFYAGNTAAVTTGKTAYGVYSNVNIATGGGTAYGFYANGTALNQFNGGVSIGRTAVTSPATTDGNVFSGTYTPTLTNTTNVSSSTASACQYMRVGNTVTVSGQVAITPTAAANTVLGITLPIASTFAATNNLGGTAAAQTTTQVATLYADTANARVLFRMQAAATTALTYAFSFTYQVI